MLHARRLALAQRQFDLRLQAGDRRLELVGGIGHEAVLASSALPRRSIRALTSSASGRTSTGTCGEVERAQVLVRAAAPARPSASSGRRPRRTAHTTARQAIAISSSCAAAGWRRCRA
jgi:hypothetical protein